MHGRLGNQFFQYAFAKKIQKIRTGDNISIYFGRVSRQNNKWGNDLIHFQNDDYEIVENLTELFRAMSFKQKIILFCYLVRCRFVSEKNKMKFQIKCQILLNKFGFYWLRNGMFTPIDSAQKNVFICGHFEHHEFYANMESQLRLLLKPKMPLCCWNISLYENICNSQSVCVSIRRGDYLSSNNKNKYFICDKNYFDKAMEEMKKRIPDAKFFLFSDDTEWIRENFKGENIYYETHNNPIWEKVRLMSACKHFVISNSTFSWWMQYLSPNENKMVVSPSRWKNGSSYKGLVSPSFITIEV